MIVRLALLASAAAFLALPAQALETAPAPGAVQQDARPAKADTAAPAPARRRVFRTATGGVGPKLPPPKPSELGGTIPGPGEAEPAFVTAPPAQPVSLFGALFGSFSAPAAITRAEAAAMSSGRPQIDALIRHHAQLNGVPESLVHRIVIRESRYNPRAVGRGGAMGLMQIKTATARGMGYQGGPEGLLDAETNLTYAVKYLAGAYRTADGNHDRAVSNYARGYFYEARRKALTETVALTEQRPVRNRGRRQEAHAAPAATPLAAAPVAVATPAPLSFARNADDRSGR